MEIPTISCENAKEFLHQIDLTGERWLRNSEWNSTWVFRGQRDAKWGLTPSAWRENKNTPALKRIEVLTRRCSQDFHLQITKDLEHYHKGIEKCTIDNIIKCYSQARAEFSVILEFLKFADDLGHPVPGADNYLRLEDHNYIPELRNYPHTHFIPEPNTATALAQHHGIPTRTIDWTYSPDIAAFFAAADVDPLEEDGEIAIWAINLHNLNRYNISQIQDREFCRFKVLKSARADNPFLNAQKGLFLFASEGCRYFIKYGEWPTIEQHAIHVANVSKTQTLYKITLPYGHVPNLLRLLWAKNISKGHLMPTYDNVTTSLISKWNFWDY